MIKDQFIPFYLGDMLASTDFEHPLTSSPALTSRVAALTATAPKEVLLHRGAAKAEPLGDIGDQWSMRPPKNKKPQHTYWFTWIDILYTELRPSFYVFTTDIYNHI